MEAIMKIIVLATCSLFTMAVAAHAQGASKFTPGHQMQKSGSYQNMPGASGYAPGHVMKRKGPRAGTTGASGYTPAYRMKHKSTTR
jgi:hypothetical protein